MLSRLSELPFAHRRRAILLGLALFAFFILVDAWLARDKRGELIANKTNDMLLTDQRLSNEFSRLLYGLEDDLTFFEKLIRENLTHRRGDQALVDFLATHRHYVKVRVTDSRGREIFKVTRHPTTGAPHLSTDLYDLSGQPFYRELTEATTDDFSFSSMDANIVNGKLETPLRPTVRVARVFRPSQGFLLVNLGGEEFLSLMQNTYSQGSHQLIDGRGGFIASSPLLPIKEYTTHKRRLPQGLWEMINREKEKTSFVFDDELIVLTRFILPRSSEQWLLLSRAPLAPINALVWQARAIRLVGGFVLWGLLMWWLWYDIRKRHNDQVVNVLLEERGQFVQNVSHQLKTPLTIMLNELRSSGELQRQALEVEVSKLLKVTENLLMLAQIEQLDHLPLATGDVVDCLTSAIERADKKARTREIRFNIQLDPIVVDSLTLAQRPILPELLETAFFNVVDNAIEHSPDRGLVNVTVQQAEQELRISISDQGPGIPDNIRQTLFTRQLRVPSEKRRGSGLGLAIALKIMQLHQGRLELENSSPAGSTFRFVI